MNKNIYIFGAHSRARTLATYLQYLNPDIQIQAYLYNNAENNPETIDGVPVIFLSEMVKLNPEYPVYLGTRGIYHLEITERLQKLGMRNIIPVTPDLDMRLRNQYLRRDFSERGRIFRKLESLSPSVGIYVVKSVFDKPLQAEYQLSEFEKEIQVGAALTEERICKIADNEGEHISDRNRQFCELTALYWIWKHASEEIVGLEHYRRHFLLPKDWVQRMRKEQVDVILPTPLYVAPNVAQNYKERHDVSDWDYMMDYMRRIHPDYYEEAGRFFKMGLYSPCNMFIMKKKVLNALCSWMFPILFICAEHGGAKEDSYQNRYPGFLSERLISLFFEKNKENYKLVYADKNFLP
ncbi:MAG: DUF4422 domain-containing protein [Lachnospiraceae bacterium]|nr:DUF4422 domain-containing protein [Lachnospiraceae bacterium]